MARSPLMRRWIRWWQERLPSWARRGPGLLRSAAWRFLDDEGPLWAGMLGFASLLALVPLLVVAFGVISAFPVFEGWSENVRSFIFDNFVPATGEVIQHHLDRFVDKATEVSAVGLVGLIVSSILLMVNMERALNRIWRADRPRSMGSRFAVYWSVLTIGPLLLGASLAITSYVASLPLIEEATTFLGVRGLMLGLAPFVFSAVAFTLIFVIVPNVSVPWRDAAAGGLVAALLFEAAKQGFTLYVTNFPAYETIYGAFAAFPVFLIWVYLSWMVTLIGASFGAELVGFRSSSRSEWPRQMELVLLYRLLRHLWQAQKEGGRLSTRELLEREPRASHVQTARLLELLESHRLVSVAEDGSWLLARDLDDVTLFDLCTLLPLPIDGAEEGGGVDESLERALGDLRSALKSHLGEPLTELFVE